MNMKKKSINYLDLIPVHKEQIRWSFNDKNQVTLEIDNTGFFNKTAQKFFKKPKTSYVHLDEMGSFVWPLIDGEKSIEILSLLVKNEFREKAEPLYERLIKYFEILKSYEFIFFKNI